MVTGINEYCRGQKVVLSSKSLPTGWISFVRTYRILSCYKEFILCFDFVQIISIYSKGIQVTKVVFCHLYSLSFFVIYFEQPHLYFI